MSLRSFTEPFWLALTVCRDDGALDPSLYEGVEGAFQTEAEAVECLRELAEEHGCEGYVYGVTPSLIVAANGTVRRPT